MNGGASRKKLDNGEFSWDPVKSLLELKASVKQEMDKEHDETADNESDEKRLLLPPKCKKKMTATIRI